MIDFKKEQKVLYQPKTTPSIIDVPEMLFFMVDGKGNPNTSEEYESAMEILYGLSYTIKMSKKMGAEPEGYFEYVVPPLEGLWESVDYLDKDNYFWTSMIRQPDFVTSKVFEETKIKLSKKKPDIDLSRARLEAFTEGLCVHAMHIGPYDDEPKAIAAMEQYAGENGYTIDINEKRRHHEIYLGDPRKTAPEKLKTVIRIPVVKS